MASTSLTDSQIHILKHTLGLNRRQTPYRNHFVTSEGCADLPNIKILVGLGLMAEAAPAFLDSSSQCFHATDEGKRVAQAYLK